MTTADDQSNPPFKLKLRSRENQPQLDAFMEDLRNNTLKTHGTQFVYLGKVLLEVSPFAGKIHISAITSHAREQGFASKALDWLTELANKHGVQLDGTIQRIGNDGLSNKELRSWYKRHGFVISEGDKIKYEPLDQASLKAGGHLGL
jgi:GNAT superfamily N-acetyltransferase